MGEEKSQNPIQGLFENMFKALSENNANILDFTKKFELLNQRESINLDKEIQKFRNETDKILLEFEKKCKQFLEDFRKEIAEKSNITVSINKADKKEIEGVNRVMKDYWYLPIVVMVLALIILLGTGILSTNFYKKSISTKQRVIYELIENGQMVIPKEEYDSYRNHQIMIREWRKLNPEDSESLDNFELGWKMRGK